jgi:tetratricopeptide (TPR) repeat protein
VRPEVTDERSQPAPRREAAGSASGTLVGRTREMAELNAALDAALGGQGRLVLLSGDPGIGKSRLADELAGAARARGALVLWGRCWEAGGAQAYWPWIQAIRGYLRSADVEPGQPTAPVTAELLQLVPELDPGRAVTGTVGPTADEPPEVARFRLFEAVTGFLTQAAARQPIVLLLDDLHAADVPSLLLLQLLTVELDRTPLLVVGAYRNLDLDRDHPLTSTVADLVRHPTTRQLHLRGLDRPEVAAYVEAVTGTRPSTGVAAAIHRETEGNALFLGEVVRLAAAEGRLADADPAYWERAIPPGVRATIGLRINRLSKECARVLSIASVLGREFGLDVLEELSSLARDELAEVMDEAAVARVVAELPGGTRRWLFAHVLIRDTLYDELPPSHRARLHARAADALAGLWPDAGPHLAELAHHACLGALDPADPRPVELAWRAGEQALDGLAYEEAVRLWRMALRALDRRDAPDERARLDLLLALGDASMRAGDADGGKRWFLDAAAVARRLDDDEDFGRAALGYGGRFVWARASWDVHVVPLLEEAIARLGGQQSPLRARLLARLAGALRDEMERDRREALSAEAVAMARALGDRSALAYVLDGRYSAIWGPDTIDERLEIAEEMLAIAAAAGDAERTFQGRHYRAQVLLEHGDIGGARRELEQNASIAEALHQPAQRWYLASMRALFALLEGRFDDAEHHVGDAYEHGRAAESMHAEGTVRIQEYVLRREQGRAAEVAASLDEAAASYWFWPWARAAATHLRAEVGDVEAAHQAFDACAVGRFTDWPLDNDWLFGMTLLADVCTSLGDARRAVDLYEALSPYEERLAFSHPIASTGSVARSLGNLATTMGRFDDAERHLEAALAANQRWGARPWVAHTLHDLVALLIARDGPGDAARAHDALRRSAALAHELGQVALLGKLGAWAARLGAAPAAGPATPSGRSAPPSAPHVFRREGEYWLVSFAGRELRVQHAKGLQYLATLLAHPDTEFHALDLVGGPAAAAGSTTGTSTPGPVARAQGDLGATLDPQAKAAYRSRIEELQGDIEEATAWNDLDRSARAQHELDFLLAELAAATGLGGRDRRPGSDAERARVNVTRTIRAAMARLGEQHPDLGRHLEQAVRTGTYCSYQSDPQAPLEWVL